jgi:hypothetical protein
VLSEWGQARFGSARAYLHDAKTLTWVMCPILTGSAEA